MPTGGLFDFTGLTVGGAMFVLSPLPQVSLLGTTGISHLFKAL